VYEDGINGVVYLYGCEWESVPHGRLIEFDSVESANEYIEKERRYYNRLDDEKYKAEQDRLRGE
jgi:hypothetical protein